MSGKNSYLAKIQQAKKETFLTTQRFTRQLCMDLADIVLNHEFGFGADRLAAFNIALGKMYSECAGIINEDTKDIEYSKAHIDAALEQIFGDRFEGWEARYY